MSDARWQTLERLFDEGLAIAPAQRASWLRGLTIDDELRDELDAMLAADPGSTELPDRFGAALLEAIESPAPGMRLGPYRLLRELGSGGMGLVYLAERADEQFRHQVAIKLIRGHAGTDAARQLRHERQILAELVHPNIARLLDGGETVHGQPYLVMEYVPGEPIVEACIERKLPLVRRIELLRDLAHAVHYAHQRLIVHRDIKPANVLLRDDGRPLLLDFGIAKLVDPESRTSSATQPWFTPAYASPEQRRGEPLSTAADIYALGLLLSELLTDKAPEPDDEGALPAPSQIADPARRSVLRRDLDRIVLRATAVDATRRYSSAEALADDLQRYLAGEPVHAVPDSVGYRFNKLLRRHPYVAAAALIVVALLGWSAWQLADERDRALRAEAHAQREAQAAEAVTDYLVELFREADPERARGASVTPSALIDRGTARLAAAQDVPAAQRARLLGAFGEIYSNLGQPEKASAAIEAALAAPDTLAPGQRAELLQELALAAEGRQRFADTERYYREAVDLLRSLDKPRELSNALAGLGLAYSRNDRNAEAEAALREAVALQTEADGANAPATLKHQVYLSEALFNAGRSEEARQLMDASIAQLRAQLPPDDLDLISSLGFYAVLLRDMGESEAAEKVLLEILEHRKALLEHDSQKIAVVHNNLGRVYYDQGRTLKAIEQFRAVFDIGGRAGAEHDPSRALDMLNLGSMYEQVGDYEQAEPLMRQGAAIIEEYENAGFTLPLARQNFGRLLLLAGKAEEARLWLEKPIDPIADRDWAMERGRQRIHLAEWHRRFGDRAQAHRLLREAQANLDDIGGPESPRIAAIERIRGLLAAAEGDRKTARAELESARTRQAKAFNDRYVGVGDLTLDLAELAHADGDTERARRELQRAREILDPQLAKNAPQRARMEALQRAL